MPCLDIQLVEELKDIFREEYGVEMPTADAQRAAVWLAVFFNALAEEAGAVTKP